MYNDLRAKLYQPSVYHHMYRFCKRWYDLILTLAGPRCFDTHIWYQEGVEVGGGGGVTLTYLKNGSKYEVRIWYSYFPTYLRYKCKIGFDMLIRSLPWQTECLEWHCCFSKFCDVKVNKKSTNIQMLPKMWSSTISKQNFQSLLPYSYWFQICEFQLEATPWTDLNRVVYEWLEKYGHSWKIAQYPRN